MQVRVLGCSGAIARGCRTTSFLVDQDLLVDAGTGLGELPLEEMLGIDDVVLTHAHLDHVAALPLMIDAVASRRRKPLRVHALGATITALREHIFNNLIWPDFSRLPSREAPFLSFHEIEVGQCLTLGTHAPKQVEVLPAVHTVPACAFAIRGADSTAHWVFSGDTGRNPPFWRRVNQLEVAMLVIETAFSDRERALAERSLHLAPVTLLGELAQIDAEKRYPIYITHTKPAETEEIMSQIGGIAQHDIRWLQAEAVLQI